MTRRRWTAGPTMLLLVMAVGFSLVPSVARASCSFVVTVSTFPPGVGPTVGQTFTVNPCRIDSRTGGIQAVGQATTVQILLQLGAVPSAANQASVSIDPTTGIVTVNNAFLSGGVGTVVLNALPLLMAGRRPPPPRTLVVAADGLGSAASCDDARATPHTTIGSAVAAAARNDTITVCPGVYREQVTITTPLRLRGEPGAIVKPAPMVANTTSLTTGRDLAAVILVADTTGVTIEGLIVDGAENGISGCAPSPSPFGIVFRNASGVIQHNTIRNLRLAPGSESCPDGTGILVQSGGGETSDVTIRYNSIHGYQQNGMTLNEPGTVVVVGPGNVVRGRGPTTGAVQRGIQIARGASGQVTGNTVANHVSADCVTAEGCGVNAIDVLISDGAGVEVVDNRLGTSQTGISLGGIANTAAGNVIVDTLVYDGIAVFGDHGTVRGNTITRSAEAGIFVDGTGNQVTGNRIQDASVGIMGTAGNAVRANTFLNTPVRETASLP